MNHRAHLPPENSSGGLNLNDIYFILFRRKWIIILFGLLGIAAAAALYWQHKPTYRSDAKLLVRYIVEDKPLMPGDNTQVRSPDSAGTAIVNSEIQILTSLDLLAQVAEAVGPSKILGDVDGPADKFAAAVEISDRLKVEVPPRSDIIKITFRHTDPAVVKRVLDRLVDEYLTRHAEIHRGLGSLDVLLSQHADQLRSKLNTTDEELRKLKTEAGVISIDETKTAMVREMSELRRELFNTEAALAETRAALPVNTNIVASTNEAKASAEIPTDIIAQYQATMLRAMAVREREFMLRSQFSDENPLVKRAREQVAEVEQQRNAWETQYPGLLKLPTIIAGAATAPAGVPLASNETRVAGLEAKAQTLKAQLETVRLEVSKLDAIEGRIQQHQRKRDLEETNYRYFSAGLERSRFDKDLGLTRNNIGIVQTPTPATKDDSKLLKLLAAALGGGFGLGLALAFLLEMFVDQSVRQVHDVDRRLHLPLFMSVPYVNGKAMRNFARATQKRLTSGGLAHGSEVPDPAVASASHPLRPMFEALRDRTLLHFKNVAHKPKLIGLASCTVGAGGTTFAAGLAAALSETGEGKVLLVDMHQPKGAAHPFFHGKHVCEIGDVLEHDKRDAGMVQENLYVAAPRDDDRKIGALARQLSNLVPRFKASDYDFIIFDMPRVSATSASVRLGAMMDLVLLMVESEKVPRKAVKQAHSLLADTGVDTQVVLNKVRNYIPASLNGDL